MHEANDIGLNSFLDSFCNNIMEYFFQSSGKYLPDNIISKASNSLINLGLGINFNEV